MMVDSGLSRKYHLPVVPDQNLEIKFISEDVKVPHDEGVTDEYFQTTIIEATKLSKGDDVKQIYHIKFALPENEQNKLLPGDTIGIRPHNLKDDVSALLKQLNVQDVCKEKCIIQQKNPKKKQLQKQFLSTITTLYDVFMKEVNLRCIPKKLLICVMAEYTQDGCERSNLEELCSKEGSKKYLEMIQQRVSFIDLLLSHPSCTPPAAHILEQLPSLTHRPYSAISSHLVNPNTVDIVFSVVTLNCGIYREGFCTGMLKTAAEDWIQHRKSNTVVMSIRKSHGFNLPTDTSQPLILVGPGTGVAPFLGFVSHRKALNQRGEIFIFYGCRYRQRDYLFKEEFEEYLKSGFITEFFLATSRDKDTLGTAKYVQDNIKFQKNTIGRLICKESAMVYVCGDATNMRTSIFDCFVDIVTEYQGVTRAEGKTYMDDLRKERRYLEDVWN